MAAQIDWTAFQNAMAIKDEAMNAQLESSEHNTSSSCDILLSRNLSLRLIPIWKRCKNFGFKKAVSNFENPNPW